MKETADGARDSEVTQLRTEVQHLQRSLSETHQELLTHRHFLEQCMETRKGVMELLANREAFSQCLEFREGIQAVLGSAQLFGEFGDRIAELDLSLAGVSDNTARHGKAISTLTEQQKRTSSTLDAVVRVVKRLAHSRSRSRGPSERHSAAPTPGGTVEEVRSVANGGSGNTRMVEAAAEPLRHANGTHAHEDLNGAAGVEQADVGPNTDQQPMEWWDGPHREEPVPRIAADHDLLLDDEQMEYDGSGDGAWDWPGWPLGCEDDVGLYARFPGLEGPGSFHPSEAGEERRYWSGSSSCGSDGRSWRRRSGRSGGTSARGYSSGPDVGIPDLMCSRNPGDAGNGRSLTARRNGSANSGMSAEVKGCVNGVLAKIEEALINLDSNAREGGGGNSRTTSRTGSGRNSRQGAPDISIGEKLAQRTPRAGGVTPHSAATPRSGATPRVRPGSAPYSNWPGIETGWQQTNSWA